MITERDLLVAQREAYESGLIRGSGREFKSMEQVQAAVAQAYPFAQSSPSDTADEDNAAHRQRLRTDASTMLMQADYASDSELELGRIIDRGAMKSTLLEVVQLRDDERELLEAVRQLSGAQTADAFRTWFETVYFHVLNAKTVMDDKR